MNSYVSSSLIAFVIFGMGFTAVFCGWNNYRENRESKTGILMFLVCLSVFLWDFGYAWMSLCFDTDFAYVPRAIALLAVTIYIFLTLLYVSEVTNYPKKRLYVILSVFLVASLVAWTQIIQKDAVSFLTTPWGYWYTSKITWARILQFASVLGALVLYYMILAYGKSKAILQRETYVLNRFGWFGIILFGGYIFDTLLPTILKIPAIPGSAVSAFISSMILFFISQNNKTFGLSKVNVSEYVFRDVSVPVIITDCAGNIILFNESTKEYLNYREKDILGKSLEVFFEVYETEFRRVKDKENICKLTQTDVNDQFGDLMYSIYFVQDVTKDKENLRMLEESRQIAESANQAKSNFLANMSHEIRTPMNAIIGMSEIVMGEKDIPEKIITQINEINAAGNNLLGIINDILDISKIEAGKYELIEESYELPSMLNDITNIIDIRVQESNTRFIINPDSTLPYYLEGDVVRVRQILLNILGNAAKFTQKGSITLSVGWNHNEAEPRLYFDVVDTGIGIREEYIEHIFGEFNQVDTRRNRNIRGTGLGLAISRHLARLMNGDITVESVYGEGSTFHIEVAQKMKKYRQLGREVTSAIHKHNYHTEISKGQLQIIPRPDAKILIVDDTKVNLMVARGLMKKYEMQIDTAESGKQAIEMVQKKDYDIVFMDHMMPEMDGIDTTRNIHALGAKYQKLTIIALTANVINEAKEMFLKSGMQDFLAKPIEPKELDIIISKWLPITEES